MCPNWLPKGTGPAKGTGEAITATHGAVFPPGLPAPFLCLYAATGQICRGLGYFSVELGVVSPNPSLPSSLGTFLPSWRRFFFGALLGLGACAWALSLEI